MTGLLIAPDLGLSLVTRRGIVTVPQEIAGWSCLGCGKGRTCGGFVPGELPSSLNRAAWQLEEALLAGGKRFEERLAVRGYERIGDFKVHGPWLSYDFNNRLADVEATAWAQAKREDDPRHALPFVIERDAALPYSDYLIVGEFLVRSVLTEVIVQENTNGRHG